MMKTELDATQARALAALVAALRPGWDEAGILAALHQARTRATAVDVAVAALRCAALETNRTPAVIPLDGAHWGEPTAVPSTRQPRCHLEGHEHELAINCRICKADRELAAPAYDAPVPAVTERDATQAAVVRAALHNHRTPDARERASGQRDED